MRGGGGGGEANNFLPETKRVLGAPESGQFKEPKAAVSP